MIAGGVLTILVATPALADTFGNATSGGAHVSTFDRAELREIKAQGVAAAAAKAKPKYEYASVANCESNRPDTPNPDDLCPGAAAFCMNNSVQQGLGPSVRLFRRRIDPAGQPAGPWVQYGITCFPDEAPGARPSVTMAMVLAAFHDTAFAKPYLEV